MRVLLAILILSSLTASAQLSLDRQVASRVQKGKWNAAEEVLYKAIRKDSVNPEARYFFSRLFLRPDNPGFHIDSSYKYIVAAARDFAIITPREKERLRKFPLDSEALVVQRKKVDSAAFERAKHVNTEQSYQQFIATFASAEQTAAATELRNEVAFVDALKINTWTAFDAYMKKYPSSLRTEEARRRYEKLLYEDKTREGTLTAYEQFYKNYPDSPYRQEAANQIFGIATASGDPADFAKFISSYPQSTRVSRAQSILYHLLKEEEDAGALVLTDSLKDVRESEKGFWIPLYRNGKYGFMDGSGVEKMQPVFASIKPDYLCGNIREDYLVVDEGVIGRSGIWIMKSPVLDASDLGSGFLKINTGSCVQAVHKSGFAVGGCSEDVKVVGRHIIALRQHLKWTLFTLTGRRLSDTPYEDVMAVDDHLVLVSNGKKMIVTISEVAALANRMQLPATRVFDDVQRLAAGHYLVKNGSLEGVLNETLDFIVPLNRQSVLKAPTGFLLKRSERYWLSGVSDKLKDREYKSVLFYGDWVKLLNETDLSLFDLKRDKPVIDLLDSLWFENKLAFAVRNDSMHVYFRSDYSLSFPEGTRVTFVKSADSTAYFFTPEKSKKNVYNSETGRKLFTYEFDELEYLGRGIFLVSSGSKKGLLSEAGKVLLPPEYAAIVRTGDNVSILKDKKFGLYSLRTRKLLKPVYERNVQPITSKWLVAYKDGAYGFVGWDGKPLGKFAFEEVRPWNDTSALVRQNFQWLIYGIGSQKPLVARIKDFRFVSETENEKVMIIHQDVFYGIVSNRRGEVLPSSFSDVINLGPDEEPLYFVEKNVEEAGIYVVIYYNKNGKLLRKQVYEGEEYEKIYCAEK